MLTLANIWGQFRVSEAMVQVYINGNVMNAARQAAKRKETVEYRDTGTRGLAIRVKSGTCYWWLITEKKKAQLAPMDAFTPDKVELLRALVPRIKLAWSEGKSAEHLITEVVGGGEHDLDKAEHKAGVRAGEWTWEIARDKFLEAAKRTLDSKTLEGHSNALGYRPGVLQNDFKALSGMPIKSIRPSDIAAVLKSILDRGEAKKKRLQEEEKKRLEEEAERRKIAKATDEEPKRKKRKEIREEYNWNQARLTHSAIRAVFKWATSPAVSPESGITENIARMVASPEKPRADPNAARAKATSTPLLATPKQLQAFGFKWLWAPDTKGDRRVKRALQLQLLTGQRVASVLRAHRIEFVRTPGRPWSYVWALGPDKMGAYRLLPLPDVASYIVHESLGYERKFESNPFLFPQLRLGKGQTIANSHFSYSTAKTILIRASDLGGPLPETFKGTHDFRRGFTTFLSDWKKLGFHDRGSVEAVTHFNEGRESVSQSIYNYDERLAEKFKVLETYQDLVLYADRDGKRIRDHHRYWELEEDEDLTLHSEAQLRELYAHMDADYEPMDGDEEEDD